MKTDAFALLGLPRRAVLNPDEVRAAFQKVAAAVHPDAAVDDEDRARRTAEFSALKEAQAILTSLPQRLRHLLALEYPDTSSARAGIVLDGAMMDLFSSVATAVQRAAAVQAKKQKAASALTKAMLAGEEMEARESLESAVQQVESARSALEAELPIAAASAGALQSCAARAGFLEKWQAQLRVAFAGFLAA
jgi:curved DNA-binding protein CbpA